MKTPFSPLKLANYYMQLIELGANWGGSAIRRQAPCPGRCCYMCCAVSMYYMISMLQTQYGGRAHGPHYSMITRYSIHYLEM
jgi:hypothetical protein